MSEKKQYIRRERGSLAGPIILIGLGLFFLLSNLGLISWNFWEVIGRLWPIFLIAIGLDLLIGRRSWLGSLIVVAVTAVLLIGGLLWLGSPGSDRGTVVETINQPLDGATSAEVTINFGVGGLQLAALPAEASSLIEGSLNLAEQGERIEQSFTVQNGVATYQLQTRGPETPFSFFRRSPRNLGWDLQLNQDVPLNLTVKTGVGESTLDLRPLNLSGLQVSSGVGQTTVMLPGHNRYTAVIEGGVGDLTVLLPEGAAAQIQVETGIGNSNILGNFERAGNLYTTPGYDTAVDRIDIQLKAGIGQVTVREVGGR